MQEVIVPPPGRRNARGSVGGAYELEQRARSKSRKMMEQKIAEMKPAKRYVPTIFQYLPPQLHDVKTQWESLRGNHAETTNHRC